jgi:hypothetical protein
MFSVACSNGLSNHALRPVWLAESCSKQHAMRTTVLPSCKRSRRVHRHYRDRLEYFRLDFAWSRIHGDPQTKRDLILPLFCRKSCGAALISLRCERGSLRSLHGSRRSA